MNGVLIIDKPAGMTSHDVVRHVRRILKERSVGHLGTLDPLATGVLPLVIGNMTRLAQFYTGSDKAYEGEIRFGFATDTYDADGEPTSEPKKVELYAEALRKAAEKFCGTIEQIPPPFSAKKVAGVPAYKLARKKEEVKLQPVQVVVRELVIDKVEGERAIFHAKVSSGTYLRSIAHELGQALGVGAHLASLRRTAVAEFTADKAVTLDQLGSAAIAGTCEELFIHPRLLLPEMPSVTAPADVVTKIFHGNAVNLPEMSQARQVKVFSGQRELIAIATRIAGTLFQPRIVLVGGTAAVSVDTRNVR